MWKIVNGKKGDIKIKHWGHLNAKDCDTWHEPITEWHLWWQNIFPIINQEVILKRDNKIHRADILLNNGLVIEVQNSPIRPSEIKDRELFYGKNNMIWILNGENLATNSEIDIYKGDNQYYRFSISIPKTFKHIKGYSYDKLRGIILNHYNIINICKYPIDLFLSYKDEQEIVFKFQDDLFKNFELAKIQLKYYIVEIFRDLYGFNYMEKFRREIFIEYKLDKEYVSNIWLTKKYWRKFIDEMKYPVFFDNLKGLKENEIYRYKENKIVDKNIFINKYLEYT